MVPARLNQGNLGSTSEETPVAGSSMDLGTFYLFNGTGQTTHGLSHNRSQASRYRPYRLRRERTPDLEKLLSDVHAELCRRADERTSAASTSYILPGRGGTLRAFDDALQIPVSQGTSLFHCPLDQSCQILVSDLKQHQKEFHENQEFSECLWRHPTGYRCHKLLRSLEALVKHVGQVHLRLTACSCRKCGRKLSRSDALSRHEQKCRGL
ncbi:uncharacterized protein C8Q71DRAFT_353056 [Rhodofomes roseus]|uniref:C2H2-type domain-containing protein n=1 Tax=Rhodofomes roseus TaxID=34475 RepID=A0ABQ8KSU3_9APHY|nr:uncharacterized protein C8Q71DRAFT_353056 [Rhodofomes roseus]KAH9841896.1 hypothetical protein C8Q71DRAFT_353056 [Rhodofomes roseus]